MKDDRSGEPSVELTGELVLVAFDDRVAGRPSRARELGALDVDFEEFDAITSTISAFSAFHSWRQTSITRNS